MHFPSFFRKHPPPPPFWPIIFYLETLFNFSWSSFFQSENFLNLGNFLKSGTSVSSIHALIHDSSISHIKHWKEKQLFNLPINFDHQMWYFNISNIFFFWQIYSLTHSFYIFFILFIKDFFLCVFWLHTCNLTYFQAKIMFSPIIYSGGINHLEMVYRNSWMLCIRCFESAVFDWFINFLLFLF